MNIEHTFRLSKQKLITRTQICQVFDSGLSNMGSVVFLFATTAWNLLILFVSSEGALIAITPYDYPQQHPLFEHTPVLDNNLNINAMMTLVTMITIKTEITKTKSAASVA